MTHQFFFSTKSPECEQSEMGSEESHYMKILFRWVCELSCMKMDIESSCVIERCKEKLASIKH